MKHILFSQWALVSLELERTVTGLIVMVCCENVFRGERSGIL